MHTHTELSVYHYHILAVYLLFFSLFNQSVTYEVEVVVITLYYCCWSTLILETTQSDIIEKIHVGTGTSSFIYKCMATTTTDSWCSWLRLLLTLCDYYYCVLSIIIRCQQGQLFLYWYYAWISMSFQLRACLVTIDKEMIKRTVDGCYAWIVLGGTVLVHFLSIGFLFGSIGVFTAEYNEQFGVDVRLSSWVGSVLTGILLCCGRLIQHVRSACTCSNTVCTPDTCHGVPAVIKSLYMTEFFKGNH